MNTQERAYRREAYEEREKLKRLGLEPEKVHKVQRPAKKTAEDYDEVSLPADYTMPVATLIVNRLLVGPPCVTQRQQAYAKERLGNPRMVRLELPPLDERRLWKLKEAVAWYESYARTLAKEEGLLYLHHETGCDEEALVGLLVWKILESQPSALESVESFEAWREETGYLWFLDREEETFLPIVLFNTHNNNGVAKKQNKGLTAWLKKSK